MPIFEYECAECGARFELLVRGGTRVACRQCDSTRVERLMSAAARPVRAGVAGGAPDVSRLGPPPGGCCGGVCGGHQH